MRSEQQRCLSLGLSKAIDHASVGGSRMHFAISTKIKRRHPMCNDLYKLALNISLPRGSQDLRFGKQHDPAFYLIDYGSGQRICNR